MSTNLFHQPPFPRRWSAQDLTNAVPHRLSELITPALLNVGNDDEAANGAALSPWAFDWRRHDRDAPSVFRVR